MNYKNLSTNFSSSLYDHIGLIGGRKPIKIIRACFRLINNKRYYFILFLKTIKKNYKNLSMNFSSSLYDHIGLIGGEKPIRTVTP